MQKEEQKRKTPKTTSLCEEIHYKKNNDEYEGTLVIIDGSIKFTLAKTLEVHHWEEEFSMEKLKSFDRNWLSLLDEEIVFGFIFESFKQSNVTITEQDDTSLRVEFKFQLGYTNTSLSIIMKKAQADLKQIVIRQGSLIKTLLQETKEMQKVIEELKKPKCDIFVLLKENDGSTQSTHSAIFTDIKGVKPGEIIIRKKCKIKWSLHLNGLYFSSGNTGYTAFFRLELVDSNNNKLYWPSDKGCNFVKYTNVTYSTSTFSFQDVAELNAGKYTIKIQWAYNSNNSSYCMSYYHNYGQMGLIIETY